MDNTPSQPVTRSSKKRSTTAIIAISFAVLSVLLAGALAYLAQQNRVLTADNNKINHPSINVNLKKDTAPPANPWAVIRGTVRLQSESLPDSYAVCAISSDTLSPYCTTKFKTVPDKGANTVTYELGVAPGRYTVMGLSTGENTPYASVSLYSNWQKDTDSDRCLDAGSTLPRVVVATTAKAQIGIDVGMDDGLRNCRR